MALLIPVFRIGVIQEVAETRCGSEEKLAKAVADGQAIKSVHKGVEMSFFPKVKLGQRDTFDHKDTFKRSKLTSPKAFEDVMGAMATLGWTIQATPAAIQEI